MIPEERVVRSRNQCPYRQTCVWSPLAQASVAVVALSAYSFGDAFQQLSGVSPPNACFRG